MARLRELPLLYAAASFARSVALRLFLLAQKKSTNGKPGLPSVALAKDGGRRTNLTYAISTLTMAKDFQVWWWVWFQRNILLNSPLSRNSWSAVSFFWNPHRSNLPFWKMADDFCNRLRFFLAILLFCLILRFCLENRKKLATLIPYCHYVFNLSRVSYSILPNNVLV